MKDLLIYNAHIFTFNAEHAVLENGYLLVSSGNVAKIGQDLSPKQLQEFKEVADIYDAQGKMVIPGFIVAHGHFYGMYARGLALTDPPAKNFMEVLSRLWWKLDLALDEESSYTSAMVNLVQAIKSGSTTIFDHHASPNYIRGSLDTVAKATKEAGVRACLCYEVTDRNGEEGMREGIEENVRFLKQCEQSKDPMLSALFGMHASLSLSNNTLNECTEAAKKAGIVDTGYHIHVAEDLADQTDCLEKRQNRVVEHLHAHGITGPKSIFAHCVHVTGEELDILKKTDTIVTHQPSSNMNNAVGVSDVLGMLSKGLLVGLGTDGMSCNMIQEHKIAYLIHKLQNKDPSVFGGEAVELLFGNNARIASRIFGQKFGVLEEGAVGDFAILDYSPPTPVHAGNFPWHLMFGIDQVHVSSTVCAGKFLMKEHALLTVDEAEVMERARKACPDVWARYQALPPSSI